MPAADALAIWLAASVWVCSSRARTRRARPSSPRPMRARSASASSRMYRVLSGAAYERRAPGDKCPRLAGLKEVDS
jgi:hypothetical protein